MSKKMMERFRSLQEQGLVERVDLEGTNGDISAIVKNVLARLREENDWFFHHPDWSSNLVQGETDPGDRQNYTPRG